MSINKYRPICLWPNTTLQTRRPNRYVYVSSTTALLG